MFYTINVKKKHINAGSDETGVDKNFNPDQNLGHTDIFLSGVPEKDFLTPSKTIDFPIWFARK